MESACYRAVRKKRPRSPRGFTCFEWKSADCHSAKAVFDDCFTPFPLQ